MDIALSMPNPPMFLELKIGTLGFPICNVRGALVEV